MIPAWLSGLWIKFAIAAAFVGLVLLAVLRLIGIGRDQERGRATTSALKRTQDANAARAAANQPVTIEEEARDPFNRDGHH